MSREIIITIIGISSSFVISIISIALSIKALRHQLPRLKITCYYAYSGATGLPREVDIPHPMNDEDDIPPKIFYEFMYHVTKIEFRIINDSSAPVTISDIELSSLVFLPECKGISKEPMVDPETFKERYETSLYDHIDCKKSNSSKKKFFREAKVVCYYYLRGFKEIWKEYHASSSDLLIKLPFDIGPYQTKDVVAYFAHDSLNTGIHLFNLHLIKKSKLIIKSAHGSFKKKIDIHSVGYSLDTGYEPSHFEDKKIGILIAPGLYNGPVDRIE